MAKPVFRVGDRFEQLKWRILKAAGLTNLQLNKLVDCAEHASLATLGVPLHRLDIGTAEYMNAVASRRLAFFQGVPYPHRKVLEYLTSIALAPELGRRGPVAICDFAGGMDVFASWAKEVFWPEAVVYAVDPLLTPAAEEGVITLRGDAHHIVLPDNSLDLITCHHSIEHFRDGMDITAVQEFARILKPGGVAVIVPVFIASRYAEIWNRTAERSNPYDPRALLIIDRTSPFPGWGAFEHFARAYDVLAFQERILQPLRPYGEVELFQVLFDGRACPDITLNKGLPALCAQMLALRFTKFSTTPPLC